MNKDRVVTGCGWEEGPGGRRAEGSTSPHLPDSGTGPTSPYRPSPGTEVRVQQKAMLSATAL